MVVSCRIPNCHGSDTGRRNDGEAVDGLAMNDKAWVQFLLLVAVPVMSLVGSWLALRAVSGRRDRGGGSRRDRQRGRDGDPKGKVNDA